MSLVNVPAEAFFLLRARCYDVSGTNLGFLILLAKFVERVLYFDTLGEWVLSTSYSPNMRLAWGVLTGIWKRIGFIRSLSPRVARGCLRQHSRKFRTLPSPLSCQINIFHKNVNTSHAKSIYSLFSEPPASGLLPWLPLAAPGCCWPLRRHNISTKLQINRPSGRYFNIMHNII